MLRSENKEYCRTRRKNYASLTKNTIGDHNWIREHIDIRILELRKQKAKASEVRDEFTELLKKAYALDRRKMWRQLKKDLQEIQMRVAA